MARSREVNADSMMRTAQNVVLTMTTKDLAVSLTTTKKDQDPAVNSKTTSVQDAVSTTTTKDLVVSLTIAKRDLAVSLTTTTKDQDPAVNSKTTSVQDAVSTTTTKDLAVSLMTTTKNHVAVAVVSKNVTMRKKLQREAARATSAKKIRCTTARLPLEKSA